MARETCPLCSPGRRAASFVAGPEDFPLVPRAASKSCRSERNGRAFSSARFGPHGHEVEEFLCGFPRFPPRGKMASSCGVRLSPQKPAPSFYASTKAGDEGSAFLSPSVPVPLGFS